MKAQSRFFLLALQKGLCHLALCAVMLLVLAPAAGAAWQCEGQECGATASVCCCVAPSERQDSHCPPDEAAHSSALDQTEKSGACPQECHCEVVIRDSGNSRLVGVPAAATAATTSLFSDAVLPAAFALNVPVSPETASRLPARAPPPTRFQLTSASRRGPPLS